MRYAFSSGSYDPGLARDSRGRKPTLHGSQSVWKHPGILSFQVGHDHSYVGLPEPERANRLPIHPLLSSSTLINSFSLI
jgi:hypothetical protein